MKKPVSKKPMKPGMAYLPGTTDRKETSNQTRPMKPGMAYQPGTTDRKPGFAYMDNTSLNGSLAEWKAAQAKKKR